MNNKIKNTFRIGIIAAAGAAAMVSCSDTWDDHYGEAVETAFSGNTLQALEENAPDFAAVVKAVGYDRELSSANVYTIWAPASFNKDSVMAVAAQDSAAVVNQFIKNHIARYSVSQNGSDQEIKLMSSKIATMTGSGKFGSHNITKANLSCDNGVLHIIDGVNPYNFNVFEKIKHLYDSDKSDQSLYAFLKRWDADSLDEARSVSRGVDENGDKIWVDSVTIRNNTVLKNTDALVYEEDSSYIGIIPSAAAYKKRYEIAKQLLNFNPSMTDRDSLQDYYANMFAMTDLFYNINTNHNALSEDGLSYDSLRSTNYTNYNWPNHLYYSKEPRKGLHPDKKLNDILSKCGSPIECSNGRAYSVNEYPMDVTEQFFKKIYVYASPYNLDQSVDDKGTTTYTKNIANTTMRSASTFDVKWVFTNEEGEKDSLEYNQPYHYTYFQCESNQNNMSIAFKIPNTLSGKYDIYLVTCPIYMETGRTGTSYIELGGDRRPYHFQAFIYERNDKGEYNNSERTPLLPGEDALKDGKHFLTDTTSINIVDTLYLGEHNFKYAYHGASGTTDEGTLLQIYSYVPNSNKNLYSKDMLISGIILRPKFDEADFTSATEAKRR